MDSKNNNASNTAPNSGAQSGAQSAQSTSNNNSNSNNNSGAPVAAVKTTKKKKKTGAQGAQSEPGEPDEVELYVMTHITRVKREAVTDEEIDKVVEQTRQEAHDIMTAVGEHDKKVRREAMAADGKTEAEIAKMEQEVDAETAHKTKVATDFCGEFAAQLHYMRQASEGEAVTLTKEMLADAPACIKENWTDECRSADSRNAATVFVEWWGAWEKRQRREDAQEARSYLQDYTRCGETQLQEIVTDVLVEKMHKDGKDITTVNAVEFRHDYLRMINSQITLRNSRISALVTAKMAKGSDLENICKDIPAAALAKLLIDAKIVRHLRFKGPGGEDVDILALRGIKPSDKKRYGIYSLVDLYGKRKDTTPFALLCSRLNPHADDKYRKTVQSALLIALEPETEFRCPGVVPVQDGVFVKHAAKAAQMIASVYPDRPKELAAELTDWTFYAWGDAHIDDLLFLRKIQTPYGEKPYEDGEKQPTLKAPKMPDGVFDVDAWWLTLYDIFGPEEAQRLVDVDKKWVASVVDYAHQMTVGMFYVNETGGGNNGKGARAAMICAMIGDTNYQDSSLNDLGGQFGGAGVENLLYMTMSELTYSDGVGSVDTIKKIITRDSVKVERKYQDAYTVKPLARIEVQTNEYPNIPDKTGSWYRRWIYMPADKHFGAGTEIPEIKSEYLVDPIVSQHLLRQVLHIELDGFGVEGGDWETETMKACRERYKVEVDPVRRFLEENLLPDKETGKFRSQWTAYPYALLHAAYLKEMQMQGLSGRSAIGLTKFKQRAAEWAEGSGYYKATDERLRSGTKDKYNWMQYEPLLKTYDLTQYKFVEFGYNMSKDPTKRMLEYTMDPTKLNSGFYGGLVRKDNIKAMPIRSTATDGKTAEDKAKDLLSGLSMEERAALLAMLTQKEDVV